jgi:phosphoenolpyruvate carboxykinase (ATP)
LLQERLTAHHVNVWLVNTGWSGGAYGMGTRMPLAYTRAMVNAAISGALDAVDYQIDPVFGLAMPMHCPGVPAHILNPQRAWQNAADWREAAQALAVRFHQNFVQFADSVPPEALAGAPVHK